MLDVILIINKPTYAQKKVLEGFACKLNTKRTYDQNNRDAFTLVLDKRGFRYKWMDWIKLCAFTI